MILCKDLLPELVLNLKWSKHSIETYDGPLKGSTSLMYDLVSYDFKDLNTGKITLDEYFTNAYADELYESEQVHTSTKEIHKFLDAKFGKIRFK